MFVETLECTVLLASVTCLLLLSTISSFFTACSSHQQLFDFFPFLFVLFFVFVQSCFCLYSHAAQTLFYHHTNNNIINIKKVLSAFHEESICMDVERERL